MLRYRFLLFPLLVSVAAAADTPIQPLVVTEPVFFDSDDPAIWINRKDPSKSLVLGTCKHAENGGLYVFDLAGKIDRKRTVLGLKRPNNVDLAYDFSLGGKRVDIAVVTERGANQLRVFTVPDLTAIDGGGLPVFEGVSERLPMGIALYRRPRDGAMYAIVSRSTGPSGSYLWQYRLEDNGSGRVRGTKVREFGTYSGTKTAESVAVDQELGFVYYSDERFGVRQYHADPDAPDANKELGVFATEPFTGDREGISIYATAPGRGYIVVSNQDGHTFRIYRREGEKGAPYAHPFLREVALAARTSDGSDITSANVGPQFPGGLFVAMSDDKTFHYYSWAQLAGDQLEAAKHGRKRNAR
jgi:3-phytase